MLTTALMPPQVEQCENRGGLVNYPIDVAVAPDGTLYVADGYNDRIQKFSPQGGLLTAFGTPHHGPGYTETAVTVAPNGTVYTVNLIQNRVEMWHPTTKLDFYIFLMLAK